MKMSLYKKLAISLMFMFVLVVVGLFLIIQSFEIISRQQAEQELHKELAAHLVHDNPLLSEGKHDQLALENLFHSMMVLGPNFEFYVLDSRGKILTYSAKPGQVKRDEVELGPIDSYLKGTTSLPVYADDPRSDKHKIFSAAPIIRDNKIDGYLYVIIGGQIYDSIFTNVKNNEQLQVLGIIAIASLLFLLIILLVGFHFFVRPLKRLTQQVGELGQIKLNKKMPLIEEIDNGVEVSELSSAFNRLILQVNSQLEQLSAVDSERRELLAHLSHDLRTPLASLKGFLETIQIKQGTLSNVDLQQYVERCVKNAQSLKGFVDQIFELAHLESGQVSVSPEAFPVADLLYDLAEKFSLTTAKKGISIDVKLDSRELIVKTDIAKLERILSNLMENAIRHTPDKGKITLTTELDDKAQSLSLIIRDTGTGIRQEELPYLFEPRYRGKQAVNDESRHIGLGLTITRKLVRLLGSEIQASNNPDGGAKFKFGLPIMA